VCGVAFRQAGPDDAAALGAVHVAAWREAYANILPDRTLADLSVEARSDMWRSILDPETFAGAGIFVAESGNAIVGFGACGSQRDATLKRQGYDGEIGALYVLRSHQRLGVGTALIGLMARNLLGHGQTAAALWVLRDNTPARAFYERIGGALVDEKVEEQAGTTLTEVAYGWGDLALLLPSG
jgi:ribosomal protein S18 acetylase RimI-like enzyme